MTGPTLEPDNPLSPQALADLARVERFVEALTRSAEAGTLRRLVLSKPKAGGPAVSQALQRVSVKPLQRKGETFLSLLSTHTTRDITQNLPVKEAVRWLSGMIGTAFCHAHLQTTDEALQLLISKRGKTALQRSRTVDDAETAQDLAPEATGHARVKQHPLSLEAPFLAVLGVTDRQGHLVPAMARKWKQINKFIEVLDHALDEAGVQPGPEGLHVVDFGSGKGYLTFATHHWLTRHRGWRAEVLGVELRDDLVSWCNDGVRQLGLEGLSFQCGDVRSVVPPKVDVMIALHACDTATDHALHTGVRAGASVIISSPCCHKQLRPQMQQPEALKGMLQHGIHLGLQAEMLTDSLRALLLESQGYRAQVFEFVALEHTSKNKMILGVRRPAGSTGELQHRDKARQQVAQMKAFYGVQRQCLEDLLAPSS